MILLNSKKNIPIILLLLMLAGRLFLGTNGFFVLSAIYLVGLIFKNNFKFVFPKIPGFKTYITMIFLGIIVGLGAYTVRSVARDILYFSFTLLWIFIGANSFSQKGFIEKQLFKTLYFYAGILTVCCFFKFIINMNWSFNGIRQSFVVGVYDIGILLPIFILRSYFNKDYVLSKGKDILLIIILLFHIILSIGRVSVFVPFLLIFVLIFFVIKNRGGIERNLGKVTKLFLIITILITIIVIIIPQSTVDFFVEKFSTAFSEINTSQIINSTERAMNNWRAYETQSALRQWENGNFIEQIFGFGLGKGIHIDYVPYSWTEMVENNEIPLLHNGYMTVLSKTGIIGLFSLLYVMLGAILKAFIRIKKAEFFNYGIMLMMVGLSGLIYTYVVNGPIQKGTFMIWGFLMGCLYTNDFK